MYSMMMVLVMMTAVFFQAPTKKREEHGHIKLIERAGGRVVLCRGRAGGAGRSDGGGGGGQERDLHTGATVSLSGEGLMCRAGETGEGGQRQALPGEVLPRRQLVHLGRDPGHSSQPGLSAGGGGHQPAGHPEPPGGQEAGQVGQGVQQRGLLLSLRRLLSQIGTGGWDEKSRLRLKHDILTFDDIPLHA